MPTPQHPSDATTTGTSCTTEVVSIPVADAAITANLWLPTKQVIGAVAMHPATATPRGFYRALGQFFAAQGYVCLTYDFRGTGDSGHPRHHADVGMRQWMAEDVPAVAHWLATHYPDVPQFAIGHSIGGHALVLNYGTQQLRGFATIAAHLPVTATIPDWKERLRVTGLLSLAGPALGAVFGYVPSSKFGLGVDIPRAAMRDWSRWARSPQYFYSDASMAGPRRSSQVQVPSLIIGASDDPWGTPEQVDALVRYLPHTKVQRLTYEPATLGVARIGHHGLGRRGTGEKVWEQIATYFSKLGGGPPNQLEVR